MSVKTKQSKNIRYYVIISPCRDASYNKKKGVAHRQHDIPRRRRLTADRWGEKMKSRVRSFPVIRRHWWLSQI